MHYGSIMQGDELNIAFWGIMMAPGRVERLS